MLDRFIDTNIHFILTTHYEAVKQYALQKENILISSVGFDEEKLLPTYRYQENILGSSNALAIAKKYLHDDKLLENAHSYLLEKRSKEESLLIALQDKEKELSQFQSDLLTKEAELNNLKKSLTEQSERLNKKEAEFNLKAKEKLDQIIELKLDEFDKIIQQYRQNKALENVSLKNIRKELEQKK